MISSKKAMERAIKHFPRELDIRKRSEKSIGGKYLRSLIEEVSSIEEALEKYRKEFFAYNYIGKEDTVIAHGSVSYVGDIDIENFALLHPALVLETDAQSFSTDRRGKAYYEEGKILIEDNIHEITYTYNGAVHTASAVRTAVWNVFDEFALFCGLERHNEEGNESLLSRCFLSFKEKTNSTKKGLKNVIKNELSQLSSLEDEEIKIEKLHDGNIHKISSDGLPVSERVVMGDADVLRGKRWDVNRWDHPFKNLSYSSVKWDEFIYNKQIGTGQRDDLKVALLSELQEDTTADVEVDLYKMSEASIYQYLKDNQQVTSIPLTLTKYEDELDIVHVPYKVVAEELVNITNDNILIESYEVQSGINKFPLEEIVIDRFDKEYEVVKGGELPAGEYQLEFKSIKNYNDFKIEEAVVIKKNGEAINLLSASNDFSFLGESLKSNAVYFYGNQIEDFYSSEGMLNEKGFIKLKDVSAKGILTMDVSDIENKYVRIGVKNQMTDITNNENYFNMQGFSKETNTWVSNEEGAFFEYEGMLNHFSMNIEEGSAGIYITVDGQESFSLHNGKGHISKDFDKPVMFKVRIERLISNKPLILKDIKYSHYEVNYSLSNGSLVFTPQGIVIPATEGKSYLNIELTARTGFSPAIEYVYIGTSLKNVMYKTPSFRIEEGDLVKVSSDLNVTLKSGSSIVNNNYKTTDSYKNNTNENVYIQIDISRFKNIEESSPMIEPIVYKNESGNYIKLAPGETIQDITIEGDSLKITKRLSLKDLIGYENGDLILASAMLKAIILRKDNSEKMYQITKKDVDEKAKYLKVITNNPDIYTSFVIDLENNKEAITNEKESFDFFYFLHKNALSHTAYYNEPIVGKVTEHIEMDNVFYPSIDQERLYAYKIQPSLDEEEIEVLFESGKDWSTRKESIAIYAGDSVISDQIVREEININQNFIVSDFMSLPDSYFESNKEYVLSHYLLDVPSGYRVSYREESNVVDEIIPRNDGYNRLTYGDIVSIDLIERESGETVNQELYTLKMPEGIILWKTNEFYGEKLYVHYTYRIPELIYIEDLSILYKIVSHKVDAYEHIGSILYTGIRDKALLLVEEYEAYKSSDYHVVTSSNPIISARIEGESIVLNKEMIQNKEDEILVYPGYYYAGQKEWYQFASSTVKEINTENGVNIADGERLNDEIILHLASSNALKNTDMFSKDVRTVSEIDLINNEIAHLNSVQHLTASDIWHEWKLFNVNTSFKQGMNGNGIHLQMENTHSYAFLDISKYAREGKQISFYAEDSVSVFLAEQTAEEEFEDVLIGNINPVKKVGNIRYAQLPNRKCGLVVRSSGVIDDIIISDDSYDVISLHEKNLSKLGFDIEENDASPFRSLLFDENHNSHTQTEIDNKGIRTSTTIEWGLTKVASLDTQFSSAAKSRVYLIQDSYLETREQSGVIEFSPVALEKSKNIKKVHVKINHYNQEAMKGIDVTLLSSPSVDALFSIAETKENTNLLEVDGYKVNNFIKVVLNVPAEKVIESVDIYVEYAELTAELSLREHMNGTMITKLYDIGSIGNYQLKKIDLEHLQLLDKLSINVRGIRKNERDLVETNWKEILIDEDGNVLNEIIFDNYEFFQFKIDLQSNEAIVRIKAFEFEVAE